MKDNERKTCVEFNILCNIREKVSFNCVFSDNTKNVKSCYHLNCITKCCIESSKVKIITESKTSTFDKSYQIIKKVNLSSIELNFSIDQVDGEVCH